MRFHRSIKLFPGVRLNLSKSGLGISAGPRGLKVGIDAKGRSYMNAGIPGTGLSVRQYAKKSTASSSTVPALRPTRPSDVAAPEDCAAAEDAKGDRMEAKSAWALVGAVALIFAGVLWLSQPDKNPLRRLPLTPQQNAILIAETELARSHPEFQATRISSEGPFPAKETTDGYEVQLRYIRGAGDSTPFVCNVHGTGAICAEPPPPLPAKKARHRRTAR